MIGYFSCNYRLVEFTDMGGMEYALKELDDTKLGGNQIRLTAEKKNSSQSKGRSKRMQKKCMKQKQEYGQKEP